MPVIPRLKAWLLIHELAAAMDAWSSSTNRSGTLNEPGSMPNRVCVQTQSVGST